MARLRWMQHPLVTLVAVAVFAYEVMSLPPWTTVGRLFWSITPVYSPTTPGEWYFIKEDVGDWRLADPEIESYDRISVFLMSRPEDVVIVTTWPVEEASGFWATTKVTSGFKVVLTPAGTQHQSPLQALERRFDEYLVQEWGAAPGVSERIVWTGYLHTAMAFLSAIISVLSLGWVRHIPARLRAIRAQRALRTNRCLSCGYPIDDLPQCPECGHTRADTEALACS